MRILDIDLDFFLDKKCTTSTVKDIERLDGESYKPWKETEVRELMEENFRLSIHDKVPGIFCIHHDEVFYHLQQLQEKNEFALTFDIDHLDAHADLGLGDSSYRYIAETILTIPVHERAYPKKINGWSGLSAGNYLCFAIACRWVSSLTYINRMDWIDDVPWFIFRDFTVGDHIQLKQFSSDQLEQMIYYEN